MAADRVTVKVEGLEGLRDALRALPKKMRRGAIRNALAAGGRLVRDEVKRRTPMLKATTASGASALAAGRRSVGTVRDAIKVRTSKASRLAGNVGVFINVKPAKNGGANNPRDPFYWRWLNFGWNPGGADKSRAGKRDRLRLNRSGVAKRKAGARFLEAGAAKLSSALRAISDKLRAEVARLNK